MLAYIGVNGSLLPAAGGTGVFAAAKANADTYNSLAAGQTFTVSDTSKGVIANDVNVYGVTLLTQAASGVVALNANGTFTYTPNAGSTATSDSFTYCAQNSQRRSRAAGTVTINFPAPSNLTVNVVDAQAYNSCNGDSTCISGLTKITDYRWIIEEDKTFWVDPNCTTNASITAPGCPHVVGPSGQSTIPTQGVQFHTSTMDYVATGCTGAKS